MNDPKLNDSRTSAPGARPGRRPVLDSQKQRLVLALLSLGFSRRMAARYVGCSASTITRTVGRDAEFADRVAHAEMHLDAELLAAIRHAAKTARYWRAAAWLLERRNPRDNGGDSRPACSTEQAIGLFDAALESLREELAGPQREAAIEKLGGLLLECEPGRSPER